jgi:tetratricopeptide (TPR) repeat protein
MNTLIAVKSFLIIMGLWLFTQGPSLEYAREVYASGDVESAIIMVDAVIKDNPEDALAYQYKGIFIRNKGLRSNNNNLVMEAIDLFQKSLALDKSEKNRIITLGNIAGSYLELKDYTLALNYYNKCYNLTKRTFFLVCTARCLLEQGKKEQAIELIRKLDDETIRNGDSPTNEGLTALNLGMIYAKLNSPEEAVKWLYIAIDLNKTRFLPIIQNGSEFNPIRKTKEFKQLLMHIREASPQIKPDSNNSNNG